MNRTVVVFAAHPDDEILGCGATIAKHVQQGDDVHVVILAEGLTSRSNQHDRQKYSIELEELAVCSERANKLLGVTSLSMHDFPDNRMDGLECLDVIKVIEKHIEKHQPQIVYTHYGEDLNLDHKIVHDAVITACRPVPDSSIGTLLFFEIASSTEWKASGVGNAFTPNWFVNISDTLELKIEALNAYKSEMREWPHSRSIIAVEHLARWRGACIGVNAAEAFVLGREIIK
jgi:N-acetylglucosamine malate deacetylase 1